MSAESVRNFYRMQGLLTERERIISLIEEMPRLAHDGLINAGQLLALINGETR